jgi:hypothetical protein
MFGAGAASAASVTYNYVITGDMIVGEETFDNAFDLFAGNTVKASGTFTADLSVFGNVTVSFGLLSGNTMSIDLNGTLLSASNDDSYLGGGAPSLTFNAGELVDFDYFKTTSPTFNSSFLFFDNLNGNDSMLGEWRATPTTLTVVPVPAAAWLLGSGLLGLIGLARRRS